MFMALLFMVRRFRWSHAYFIALMMPSLALCFSARIMSSKYKLSSGLDMQTLVCRPPDAVGPTLVFVHGSNHGAWCWAEHWMEYLANGGMASVALNLRGTAGAYPEEGYNDGRKSVRLRDHMSDLESAVTLVAEGADRDGVILLGHSFGGLLLAKMMETKTARKLVKERAIKGLALLCAVPPIGSSAQIRRMIFTKPILAYQVTMGLAVKKVLDNVQICRRCFMNEDMPDDLVKKYMEQLRKDSDYGLNLQEINANLPILVADEESGVADWIASEGNPDGLPSSNILVLGGSEDVLVDAIGLRASASFCGVEPVIMNGLYHDLMLDTAMWKKAANVVAEWVKSIQESKQEA